ncbi:MAG: VRR-NUC domain-containing protein [Deltaproteobacteria bacterium]|nr:VRR-NUC domain-containing protein [Deltaproteobacteria bacterium]
MSAHPQVEDLRDVLELGLARGGELLTGDERAVARALLALDGAPALVMARLCMRQPRVYVRSRLQIAGVEPLASVLDGLIAAGLLSERPPPALWLAAMTVPELQAACRSASLPVRGRRGELVGRLLVAEGWDAPPVVEVVPKALCVRLRRFASLRARPDPSRAVVERLGLVRWPDYPLTAGGAIFPDRGALLAWEAVVDRVEELDADEVIAALDLPRAPGRLSIRGRLLGRAQGLGRALERGGRWPEAAALYQEVLARTDAQRDLLLQRLARCQERGGQPAVALETLVTGRDQASGEGALALDRSARRIARGLRRSLAPLPPLAEAPVRDLHLAAAEGGGPRPLYRSGGGPVSVEDAVQDLLTRGGAQVLRGEGPLWTTLFALLFAEAYLLPIPGMLPVPRLSGPLDLGRPSFWERRRDAIAEILDAVDRGAGPSRVAEAEVRWRGVRLGGAQWSRLPAGVAAQVVEALGPSGVRAVMVPLLREGWRAAAGLPDLVVLCPRPTSLSEAFPSRLGAGLHLIEVKGPGDSLRDGQRVWLDRLVRAGLSVELWAVRRGQGDASPG